MAALRCRIHNAKESRDSKQDADAVVLSFPDHPSRWLLSGICDGRRGGGDDLRDMEGEEEKSRREQRGDGATHDDCVAVAARSPLLCLATRE